MRAPFQILAIPYRIINEKPVYCVLHRADHDQWQFIAGGGEDEEPPLEAAKREAFEEAGVKADRWIELTSMCCIPATVISEKHRRFWSKDTYVIPEYAFGFKCNDNIKLSHEHTDLAWLSYEDACARLKWDSNRTALFELDCRLKG